MSEETPMDVSTRVLMGRRSHHKFGLCRLSERLVSVRMHQDTNSGHPLIRNRLVESLEKREVGVKDQRAEEGLRHKGLCLC